MSYCWWSEFQVRQHYKVTMSAHSHKSVSIPDMTLAVTRMNDNNKQTTVVVSQGFTSGQHLGPIVKDGTEKRNHRNSSYVNKPASVCSQEPLGANSEATYCCACADHRWRGLVSALMNKYHSPNYAPDSRAATNHKRRSNNKDNKGKGALCGS